MSFFIWLHYCILIYDKEGVDVCGLWELRERRIEKCMLLYIFFQIEN